MLGLRLNSRAHALLLTWYSHGCLTGPNPGAPTGAFERLADKLHQRRAPQALRNCVKHAGVGLLLPFQQPLAHRGGPQHLRAAAALSRQVKSWWG